MVNTNAFIEANLHRKNKHICQPQQWYQSKILGKPLRRMSQSEFAQRHIKREKEERIGKCIRQKTKDCKNMLRKKIDEIEVYNSTISQNKYKRYNCFYCNQKGRIFKSCPAKIKNEVEHAQGLPT
ncbi:hypothetical protein Tco_0100800 [Tanacetum coccineum]